MSSTSASSHPPATKPLWRIYLVFLVPMVDEYLPRRESVKVVELLSRLVISYFLAPSEIVDFGDPASAREFITTYLPAIQTSLTRS